MLKRIAEISTKAYSHTLVIASAILVILAVYQVAARYFLGLGITWTEEIMRFIYVAIIMICIGTLTKSEGFATIRVFADFIDSKSKIGSIILKLFRHLIQITFYILLTYYGTKLCLQATTKLSTVTRIPFFIVYLPIPLGAFMGVVNSIQHLIEDILLHLNKKGASTNGY
ncbi:MAG: TRAP transporter small permease [Bacillota bacterium]|jgi:TRAP-type C4-dicarboxylate transport system permease small subunit